MKNWFQTYRNFIIIGVVIVLVIAVISIKLIQNDKQEKNHQNIKEYKVNGEVEEQTTTYKLYEFVGVNCPACEAMEDTYQKVKGEYESKMNFEQVDVTRNMNLSNKYRVTVIPTFIIVDKEGNVKRRKEGLMEEQVFKEFLDSVNGEENNAK